MPSLFALALVLFSSTASAADDHRNERAERRMARIEVEVADWLAAPASPERLERLLRRHAELAIRSEHLVSHEAVVAGR